MSNGIKFLASVLTQQTVLHCIFLHFYETIRSISGSIQRRVMRLIEKDVKENKLNQSSCTVPIFASCKL